MFFDPDESIALHDDLDHLASDLVLLFKDVDWNESTRQPFGGFRQVPVVKLSPPDVAESPDF